MTARSFTSSDPDEVAKFCGVYNNGMGAANSAVAHFVDGRLVGVTAREPAADTLDSLRAEIDALRMANTVKDQALEDLRKENGELRTNNARVVARNRVLEAREERHRQVSAGKWDDEAWEGK